MSKQSVGKKNFFKKSSPLAKPHNVDKFDVGNSEYLWWIEYLSWKEASCGRGHRASLPASTARTNTSGRSPDQPEAEPVQIVAAMRPRAFAPPCLPGSGPLPGLAVPGRGDLFPAAGSVVGRRAAPAPAGRGAVARAVDGPSAAAAVAAAAASAAADVPPPQITWQIVVGAVGASMLSYASVRLRFLITSHKL